MQYDFSSIKWTNRLFWNKTNAEASSTQHWGVKSVWYQNYRLLSPAVAIAADIGIVLLLAGLGFLLFMRSTPDIILDATLWTAQAPLIGALFLVLFFCIVLSAYFRGHYSRPLPSMAQLHQLFGSSCYAFFISVAVLLAADTPHQWRWMPVFWLLLPPIVVTNRFTVSMILRRAGLEQMRVLLVGSTPGIQHLQAAMDLDWVRGYRVVGHVDLDTVDVAAHISSSLVQAYINAGVHGFRADFVIASLYEYSATMRDAVLEALSAEALPFALIPDLGRLPVQGCDIYYHMSHAFTMLMFRNHLQNPIASKVKVIFDRVLALTAVFVLAPVFVVVAIAVRLDGGPVLFRHTRIGQNGRPFTCFKFRSMAVDADNLLQRVLASDPEAAEEWTLTQKLRSDPRVTRVGRILRNTSLDELPQLFNVLHGDMSLVGPRPIVAAELIRYGDAKDLYYRLKPGMTGLWQVSGRSGTTYSHRVALDTWYVKNWSLWHDLAILIKTIPALLRQRDAA